MFCQYTQLNGLCVNTKFTRPALLGYRCLTTSEVYDNINGIQPYLCVHICIRRNNCSVVNYDIGKNTCHLNNDSCISLIADTSFQINYLSGISRSECLQWLDSFEVDDFTPVAVRRCEVGHPTCYVGRLRMPPHVLPGKYYPVRNRVYSVINGDYVYGSDLEILAVRPGCQVTWMPFRAGDTIPVGAVEGGYLSNRNTSLFVVRGQGSPSDTVPGYYDPVEAHGYLEYYGVLQVTDMDVLVLL